MLTEQEDVLAHCSCHSILECLDRPFECAPLCQHAIVANKRDPIDRQLHKGR